LTRGRIVALAVILAAVAVALRLGAAPDREQGEARADPSAPIAAWIDGTVTGAALPEDEGKALYREAVALVDLPRDARPRGLDDADVWRLAQRVAAAAGLPDHEGNALWQRARIHIERGELDAARTALDDGTDRLGERATKIAHWLLLERAALARREFELALATDLLERARRRARPDDAPFHAVVEGELGRIYQNLGLVERAAMHFERERELAAGLGDRALDQAVALHAIRHAEATRRPAEVVERANEMLSGDLGFDAGNRAEIGMMRAKAELFTARGDAPAERAALARLVAAALHPDLGPILRPVPLALVAATRARLGEFETAERELGVARDFAAEVERSAGDKRGERELLDEAMLDAIAARVTVERLAGGDLDLSDADDRALVASRHARLVESLRAFVEVWAKQPPRPGGVGVLQYGSRTSVVGELVALDAAIADDAETGARAGLERILHVQSIGSLGRALGAGEPSLEEIRARLLAPGRGLLVYLFSDEAGHVIAVGPDSIEHAAIEPVATLLALRRRLVREVALPPSSEPGTPAHTAALARAEDAARELANALLPPRVRARLADWDEVLVSGTDDLGPFPFAALPGADDRPLGLRLAISHLPSVPVAVAISTREETRGDAPPSLLLLAAPTPSADANARFGPLDPLELEASELAALSEPFAVRSVFRGPDATRAALDRRSRPSVLHLFTHGVYASERFEPAGLVLAPSADDPLGIFTCDDARSMSAPGIVVLSACGAGRTSARRGEDGVGTFAGAFLSAGARAVVLSADDLDARATAALTAVLTRELASGTPPAEAMRRARVELHGRAEFAHPSFHAKLRVVGLGF